MFRGVYEYDKRISKYIVSNDKEFCFIHKTHKDYVESIMKEGLGCGPGDLRGTAIQQPREIEIAEGIYRNSHKGNNATVIVKIPKKIIKNLNREDKSLLATVDKIGYLGKRGFTIKPEYIEGWIDKDTDKYFPNPYKK